MSLILKIFDSSLVCIRSLFHMDLSGAFDIFLMIAKISNFSFSMKDFQVVPIIVQFARLWWFNFLKICLPKWGNLRIVSSMLDDFLKLEKIVSILIFFQINFKGSDWSRIAQSKHMTKRFLYKDDFFLLNNLNGTTRFWTRKIS